MFCSAAHRHKNVFLFAVCVSSDLQFTPKSHTCDYCLLLTAVVAYCPACCRKFVAQLSRLCAPGGTVILVDFCRAPGPASPALQKRLAAMDRIFATPGNWHSAEEYKRLMGEWQDEKDGSR